MLGRLQEELEAKGKAYIMKFAGRELPTERHTYAFANLYEWVFQPTSNAAAMADIGQKFLSQTLSEMKAGMQERYAESGGVNDPIRAIEKAEFCLQHMRESIARGVGDDSFEDEVYMDALRKVYDEIVEACIGVNEVFKNG